MTISAFSWQFDLPAAQAQARRERRFVLADYVKEHCAGCIDLETLTYPVPEVQTFIAEHFVPVKLTLNNPVDQPHFRAHEVIWTPTIVIIDGRGVGQYQSLGYLPADLFLAMLRIGLARAQLAWSRYAEAAIHLSVVANETHNAFAPESLYWLGVCWYLQSRRRAPMMQAWQRLRQEHPNSIWAARIPPNQEILPEI